MKILSLLSAILILVCMSSHAASTLDTLSAEVTKRLATPPDDPKQLGALKSAQKALEKANGEAANDIAALGKADFALTAAFPNDSTFSTLLKGDRGILQQAILDQRDSEKSDVARMKDAKKKAKAEDMLKKINDTLSTALSAKTTDAKSLLSAKKQLDALQKLIDSDRGGGTLTANLPGFGDLPAYILVKENPSDAPTAKFQIFASGYLKSTSSISINNSLSIYVFNPAKGTFPFKPVYARPANANDTVAYAQYYENNHFFTSSAPGAGGSITITAFDLTKETFAATFTFSATDEHPDDNPVITTKSINITGQFFPPQKGK